MGTNSAERLASVVGELITMVNNSPAALIIASQVDRGLDKALNHRPDLSSFKGSGGLEEGADVAMALYRPKFYDPSMDDSAELIVLKNRLGPLGTINLVADLAHFRFYLLPLLRSSSTVTKATAISPKYKEGGGIGVPLNPDKPTAVGALP